MKKLIYVLSVAIIIASCSDEPKDYATLSGKIINNDSDSLIVMKRDYQKKIKINADGTFSDTLKSETGRYGLIIGNRHVSIYLENGYDLELSVDAKDPNKTITYKGVGAEANIYLSEKQVLETETMMNSALFDLEKGAFDKKMMEIDNSYKTLLDKLKNVDSNFVQSQNIEIEYHKKYLLSKHEDQQYTNTFLAKGKESPKFVNYENYNGKKTSLIDLKGKYVFIALWTAGTSNFYLPEVPHLQLLEKEFQGKNIAFVTICINSENEYNAWKQFIVDAKLGGIQLFAKEDRSFRDAYRVKGTPRFILIDPNGNIVSAKAPNPSSNDLKVLFDSLKL